MTCAVHPDEPSVATCVGCKKALCRTCATHTIDGAPSCTSCAETAIARTSAFGGVVIAASAAVYVLLLAIGIRLTAHARVLGAGLAAVGTIGFGRVLQLVLKVPTSVEPIGTTRVDAAAGPR